MGACCLCLYLSAVLCSSLGACSDQSCLQLHGLLLYFWPATNQTSLPCRLQSLLSCPQLTLCPNRLPINQTTPTSDELPSGEAEAAATCDDTPAGLEAVPAAAAPCEPEPSPAAPDCGAQDAAPAATAEPSVDGDTRCVVGVMS